MTTRKPTTQTDDTQTGTALDAYRARLQTIGKLQAEIQAGLQDHANEFHASGETNWASVGDLGRYENQLRDIADSLLKRGEYFDVYLRRARRDRRLQHGVTPEGE